MIFYPNQRVIIVHRAERNGRSFTQINKEVSAQAFRELSYPEFRLWYYLCGNIEGYKLALSPADMETQVGLARSSYYKAWEGLLSKGYIQLAQGNHYYFFECGVSTRDSAVDTSEPPVSAVDSPRDTTYEF